MAVSVHAFDIGCEPSPSVPAETVLQDGRKTYLLFFAVSKEVGPNGSLSDLGVAVVDCHDCVISKFGYPNDEGANEHPLYERGMADISSAVLEVIDSDWVKEVEEQRMASARRIWGQRGVAGNWQADSKLRHFIVILKEKTFECLADSIVIGRYCASFEEAFDFVFAKFQEH